MFCSSLRRRPAWAHIVPVLLNDKTVTWKETNLESHDVAFPVYKPGTPMNTFRITLLTARDMEASSGRQRVATLSHASGAKAAAVLFLLGDDGPGGETAPDAMEAFMKLQIEAVTSLPMTLIPLASMSDLYPTLLSLRKRLNQGPGATTDTIPEGLSGVSVLLSSCLGRHLTPSERIALRRVPITSVQDLVQKAVGSEGQATLREHLGEGLVNKVIEFFASG